MMRKGTILVATDLSEVSKEAVRVGQRLAALMEVSWEVMHIIDEGESGPFDIRGWWSKKPSKKDLAIERLEEWCEEVSGEKPDETQVITGLPDHELRKRASQNGVTCLVMAMSGRGAWNRLVFGSTALKLSSRPPCPVAVVHPDHHRLGSGIRVGLGTDFSDASSYALPTAAWLSRRLQGSLDIVFAHALPSSTVIHEGPPGQESTEIVDWGREKMDAFVQQHDQELQGIDVNSHIIADHPVSGLRQFVENQGIDWLVLGDRAPKERRGATTVKGKWVQRMTCSTLIIPSLPQEAA